MCMYRPCWSFLVDLAVYKSSRHLTIRHIVSLKTTVIFFKVRMFKPNIFYYVISCFKILYLTLTWPWTPLCRSKGGKWAQWFMLSPHLPYIPTIWLLWTAICTQITQDCKTHAKQPYSFSMAPKSLDLLYVFKYGEEHYVSELCSSSLVGKKRKGVSYQINKQILKCCFPSHFFNSR